MTRGAPGLLAGIGSRLSSSRRSAALADTFDGSSAKASVSVQLDACSKMHEYERSGQRSMLIYELAAAPRTKVRPSDIAWSIELLIIRICDPSPLVYGVGRYT